MGFRLFVVLAGFTLLTETGVALASPILDVTPPRIQQAPSEIFYRRSFVIVSPDADRVAKVGILSVNIPGGENRSVTLAIAGRTPTTLTVDGPATPSDAPAGQYLLFIYAQGLDGLVPSLPALVTLAVPPTSPHSPPGSPTPHHSPKPGGTTGRTGGNGSGNPPTSGTGTGGAKSQPPSAALARPARGERTIGTEPWIGAGLLVLLLGTFFGLRRMLRS